MAVQIRLRRPGKNPKGKPHFRIAVFHSTRSRDGRFIELLGYYNPVSGALKINSTRLEYWVKNGAQLSSTLKSIIKKSKKEVK